MAKIIKPSARKRLKTRRPLRSGTLERDWLEGNFLDQQDALVDFADDSQREAITQRSAENFQRLGSEQPFDGWTATATANQTAVKMDRFGSSSHQEIRRAVAGSVTRLEVVSDKDRTAGTLDVTLYINDTATEFKATLNAEEPTAEVEAAAFGEFNYAIREAIDLRITTSSDWTPTDAKIYATIFLSEQ